MQLRSANSGKGDGTPVLQSKGGLAPFLALKVVVLLLIILLKVHKKQLPSL